MFPESLFKDPETAAYAWARYKRLMRFMLLVTIGVVVLALAMLYDGEAPVSVHFYIATALGIGFMMLLTSALMGLVFLSSATGHDENMGDLSKPDLSKPDLSKDNLSKGDSQAQDQA